MQKQLNATIVIDVFRAFSTACYILADSPARYFLATDTPTIMRLANKFPNAILVGKPEIGCELKYDVPNSPTRIKEIDLKNRIILHRTEAGAKGVMSALEDSESLVFVASFLNADATVQELKRLKISNIKLQPMGHEGKTSSLEDDVCAKYIEALFNGQLIDVNEYYGEIRNNAGKYFFQDDQWQYPFQDFDCCLQLESCHFAIQALRNENYACLRQCDVVL